MFEKHITHHRASRGGCHHSYGCPYHASDPPALLPTLPVDIGPRPSLQVRCRTPVQVAPHSHLHFNHQGTMNQLSRSILLTCAFAASVAANAADISITIESGDSVRTISRPLAAGQAIEIDERKTIDFKAIDGCEGINITGPATFLVTGLQLKIDAVQDIGDAYFLRISYEDSTFAGKRTEQYRPGCTLH